MSTEFEEDRVQQEIEYESITDFIEGALPNMVSHISDLSDYKRNGDRSIFRCS